MSAPLRSLCFGAVFVTWLCSGALCAGGLERAAAMSPLYIRDQDWAHFEYQLREAKDIGVQAVSTDVWWGLA